MADECEYLEYRPLPDDSGDDGAGEVGDGDDSKHNESNDESDDRQPRAYCTAADQFVQAMRADICNRRYGLDPETDCEFYRAAEGLSTVSETEGSRLDAGGD